LTLLKSPPGFEKLSPTLSVGGNHISGRPAAQASPIKLPMLCVAVGKS
jgi:hypothetical protein